MYEDTKEKTYIHVEYVLCVHFLHQAIVYAGQIRIIERVFGVAYFAVEFDW